MIIGYWQFDVEIRCDMGRPIKSIGQVVSSFVGRTNDGSGGLWQKAPGVGDHPCCGFRGRRQSTYGIGG